MERIKRRLKIGGLLTAVMLWWCCAAVLAAQPQAEITDGKAYLVKAWERTLTATESGEGEFALYLESVPIDMTVRSAALVDGGPDYTMKITSDIATDMLMYGNNRNHQLVEYLVRRGSEWTMYDKTYRSAKWRKTTVTENPDAIRWPNRQLDMIFAIAQGYDPGALTSFIAFSGATAAERIKDAQIVRQTDQTVTLRASLDTAALRTLALARLNDRKIPDREWAKRAQQAELAQTKAVFNGIGEVYYNVDVDKQSGQITRLYADLSAPLQNALTAFIGETPTSKKDKAFFGLLIKDAKLVITANYKTVKRAEPLEVPKEIIEQTATKK